MTLTRVPSGERRTYPRVRALYLVTYTTDKDGFTKTSANIGRTLDISSSGTRLEVYEKIAPDTRVEVEIDIRDTIFAAGGKCVHAREIDTGIYVAGIEFYEVHAELAAILHESGNP
jgi:hypothetical protein